MPDPAPERLGERLVQVTLDLLGEQGLEGLTLRRIARRAGVSHGAPLRHFRGLAELLSEVAARGFEQLREAIEKSGASLAPTADPQDYLRAGARAYVECALASPGLFALMFRPEHLDTEHAALLESGSAAFERVVWLVRAAQDGGWQPERDTRMLAGSVWATVHGLATLWAQGAFRGAVPAASLDEALHTTLELILSNPPEHEGQQ